MAKVALFIHPDTYRLAVLIDADVVFIFQAVGRKDEMRYECIGLPRSILPVKRGAEKDRKEVMALLKKEGWQWFRTCDTTKMAMEATRDAHGIPKRLGRAMDKAARRMVDAIMSSMKISVVSGGSSKEEWPDQIDG